MREEAESTKMRIVYDASAKSIFSSPSLNECLQTGPQLQNLLWNVLIRNRFSPVALCGDIKQAFLQVHVKEEDRDTIRFHWFVDKGPNQIETYRFTRALFGHVQSPFILGVTLTVNLRGCKERYPIEVDEILRSLYEDDVISGEASFKLHKLHSNIKELEDNDAEDGLTYAKSQFGVRRNETKILGVI